MDQPSIFFSVIIPVYNDEKNLPRCLDSVMSQTYDNFECLIINDGSNDSCPSICDDYKNKDSRFLVFHKHNEGISKTRQKGVTEAKGKYIIFIDSDDWVESAAFYNIAKILEQNKTDILFVDFFEETSAKKELRVFQKPTSFESDKIIRMILSGELRSCLWNVIIGRDFYIQNNISFSETVNYGEDTLFILEYLLNNAHLAYEPYSFYHHTYNQDSFTLKNRNQKFIERSFFLNELQFLLEKFNRIDLNEYNLFPLKDKYEALCYGSFSRQAYQTLYPAKVTCNYLKYAGFRKCFYIILSDSIFYFIAKFLTSFIVWLKRMIKNAKKNPN